MWAKALHTPLKTDLLFQVLQVCHALLDLCHVAFQCQICLIKGNFLIAGKNVSAKQIEKCQPKSEINSRVYQCFHESTVWDRKKASLASTSCYLVCFFLMAIGGALVQWWLKMQDP